MTADSNERIARYLDGEMDAGERATFEQELQADAQLEARVAAWLAQDRAARTAIEDLLQRRPLPLPAGLASPASRMPALRRKGHFRGFFRPDRPWAVPAALAASLALVLLVSPMVWRDAAPSYLQALDRVPAGQSVALADGRRLDAVLTFAAGNGDWCREYAMSDGTRGIACRSDGSWRREVELADAAPDRGGASVEGYVTAGASEDTAIEEAYARLGAGIPLGTADEARVMRSGWTEHTN